jgi:glycosyltransferase involved in cell wall biosynthesis
LGKPVVTLDVGCTRKFIRHGQTGLLYKPYDLEGAARGIEQLVREKSFRKDLGRRAKEFSRRILLTWPERLNQEVAIYRRFIRSSSV